MTSGHDSTSASIVEYASPQRASLLGRSRGLWLAVGGYVLTRIIVILIAYTAPQHREVKPANEWWSVMPLVRWDSGYYLTIAMEGYPAEPNDTVAFFPLYSLISRPLAQLVKPPEWGLVAVANLSGLGAILLFYLWSCRYVPPSAAMLACWLLSAYPSSMFLSAAYSDATFILLEAAVLLFLSAGSIWGAAWMSGIASAARPTGVCLAALVWFWAIGAGWWRKSGGWLGLLLLGCLSMAGLAAVQIYYWRLYGRPDAFFSVQGSWQTTKPADDAIIRVITLKPIIQPFFYPLKALLRLRIQELLNPQRWNGFWNVVVLIIAFIGLIRSRRIPRLTFILPILVCLQSYLPDPIRGLRMVSIARYQLMALPCFLLAADWLAGRRAWRTAGGILLGMMALQCVYMARFVAWEFVG